MSRPLLYDVFCGAGGASVGYHRSGFDVVGIDHAPQKRYPFTFIQMDAFDFFAAVQRGDYPLPDAWHCSPPCQAYSPLRALHPHKIYPDLLADTRDALRATGRLWAIENVMGAPMHSGVMLCGTMFPPLRVFRHRCFETSHLLMQPHHPKHATGTNCHGRNRKEQYLAGSFVTVAGDVGSYAGEAMGISWMTGKELSQAIPPAYTLFIGTQLRQALL